MKNNYYLITLLALILLSVACTKDKGNYTYENLESHFVDEDAIPKSFVVKQNETVNVAPANTTSAPGNLSYEWRLLQQSYSPDPATGAYVDKQLATTKNLSYRVVEAPGSYILVLYVTDKSNGGISQIVKMPFTVSSYASIGWMVLHGNNTGSDLSIIVNSKLNNLLTQGTDYIQSNVFSETNGIKIKGQGAELFYMGNHWVDIFTKDDKGGYRVSGNDLRVLNNYGDMFLSPLSAGDVQFQAYASWSYNELLVNKGDLYFISQGDINVFSKFGVKCFGEDYVAAPFIGSIFTWSYYGVIYDTKHKRFLYIDYNRDIKQFKAPGTSAKFDLRNVGKQMVYAEHGFDTRWFCVMQDENNPATRELYVCKFNVMDDGNRGVARINISAAQDLSAAKYFAFGNKGNIMYYGSDTKIYQNNYSGDLASTLRYDVSAVYPGSVITSMKMFKASNHPGDGKILYVALSNPGTKEGTILQIEINEVSGVFGTIKGYTGFGEISAMNFKSK